MDGRLTRPQSIGGGVDLQEEKVTVVDLYGRLRNNLMNPLAKSF